MEQQHASQNSTETLANANNSTVEGGTSSLQAPGYSVQNSQETEGRSNADSTWDGHTNRRIKKLHPRIQAAAFEFINRAQSELGINLRVTSGLRSYSEQNALYAKGRTAPGGRVTNARGGQSYHNFGLAIDVVEIKGRQVNWDCDWNAIGRLGESIGWEWGGNWTSIVDKPHFQMAFGLSTRQLRSMYEANGGNYVNLDGKQNPVRDDENEVSSATDQTPTVKPNSLQISKSVGKRGQNLTSDTRTVQTLLNKSGAKLKVDGDCGPLTIAAIEAFQMSQFGWKDGRVDVNGKTWKALNTNAAPKPLIYSVKRGDNLTKIAEKFKVSVSEILSANPSIKNPNTISIGQKITIPTKGADNSSPQTSGPDKVKPSTNTNSGGGSNDGEESTPSGIIFSGEVSNEFAQKVVTISNELGIEPNYLMAAMAFESGGTFDPKVKNIYGSGATGLIQFMPKTAKHLLKTDTRDEAIAQLMNMSAVEQLDVVRLYFLPYKGKIKSLEDIYMAILWPRAVGKPNDYVLWRRGSETYKQNSGLDGNNDGKITKGEAAGKVRDWHDKGIEQAGLDHKKEEDNSPETSANDQQSSEHDTQETTNQQATGSTPSSSNFSINEFNCKDGTHVPKEYYPNVQELMSNLEILRAELGGNSITVNSGYRSPAHNAHVGGKKNSQHLYAKAADIKVSGHSPRKVHSTIARLIREGKMKQGGLGRYNTFTHYDVRGNRARW